jgi:hypothetical protein
LSRLPQGKLWRAFCAEANPYLALETLGESAIDSLVLALDLLECSEQILVGAGFPGEWRGSSRDLANALVADGSAIAKMASGFSRNLAVAAEVRWIFPSHLSIKTQVQSCLHWAAQKILIEGQLKLPMEDALLLCPDADLRSILGIADSSARYRFAAALLHSHGSLEDFERNYFRRSCVEGIQDSIRRQLTFTAHGVFSVEDGWPTWWQARLPINVEPASVLPPFVSQNGHAAEPIPNPLGVKSRHELDADAIADDGMPTPFVIHLSAMEATQLFKGWPEDFSLLVIDEGDDQVSWEIARDEELSAFIGLRPVWPPIPGHRTATVDAAREISIVSGMAASPTLVEQAHQRLSTIEGNADREILAADIDWG